MVLQKHDIHFHLAAGMNADFPSEQPSVPVYMKTMYMHCGCRDSIISSNYMFTLVAFAGIEISTALQTPLRVSVVIVFSVSGLYDPLRMRSANNFFGLPTFLTEFCPPT